MISKNERQLESSNKWKLAKGKGTLNLITRFGKTKVIDIITNNCINRNKNLNIIAIAPNDVTKKNIISNVTHCDIDNTYTSNQIINYFKLINKDLDTRLLIIDEVHKCLDNDIYEAIKRIKYKYILCLTGVNLNKEQIKKLEELEAPIIDVITETDALENNWISDFIEYNLAVELDDVDKLKYEKYSDLIHETLNNFKDLYKIVNNTFNNKIFDSDFDLIMSCFIGKYHKSNYNKTFIKPDILRNIVANVQGWSKDLDISNDYGSRIDKYWNPDNIYEKAKTFKSYITNRNNILIYNRPKINMVMEILNRNNVPTICFNESIEMAETLTNLYPKDSIAYHNSIESRPVWDKNLNDYIRTKAGDIKKIGKIGLKKLAIEGIKNGNYNKLFTVKSLNEGLTIENIEQIITTGGSINPQTHENRVARGKTFDYTNPNKVCMIINLYIDDFVLSKCEDDKIIKKEIISRDKQKLKERQINLESSPIWVTDIKDIFDEN